MCGKKYVIVISSLIFLVSILAFSVVASSGGIQSYPSMTKGVNDMPSNMMEDKFNRTC